MTMNSRDQRIVETIGEPRWRPMLRYVADLHRRSTHPPQPPFPFPWEEIGPGYCYGPAFGHWDLIHQVFDALVLDPRHARHQILNNLAAQQDDGLVPGSIWVRDEEPRWSHTIGHPPVWPVAVQDYADRFGVDGPDSQGDLIAMCYEPLLKQLHWFETQRAADPIGFYYMDILTQQWESGIDEGVRFDQAKAGPYACVDATSHVYAIYEVAAAWSEHVGTDPAPAAIATKFREKARVLRDFIQNELFDEGTGFFYDKWAIEAASMRRMAFEGMWPVVVGAATPSQAQRVIDENLLNPARFFAPHPIATVGVEDPRFELRMWRGPTWNSMTYWAARGCVRYGHEEAAYQLLERALDATTAQFERTGTVWEFYHPHGGQPEELRRKPQTPYNSPCRDYLGHNPLIAMAHLYDECRMMNVE